MAWQCGTSNVLCFSSIGDEGRGDLKACLGGEILTTEGELKAAGDELVPEMLKTDILIPLVKSELNGYRAMIELCHCVTVKSSSSHK